MRRGCGAALFALVMTACGSDPPYAGPCASDAPCRAAGEVCTLDESAAAIDLEPAVLVCAPPRAGGVPGDACEAAADCDRGLCVVAGTCVAACERDDECGTGERCAAVYIRTSASTLSPARGCVTRVELAAGASSVDADASASTSAGSAIVLRLPFGPPGTSSVVVPDVAAHLTARTLTTVDPETTLFDVARIGPTEPAPRSPLDISSDTHTVRVPLGTAPVASPLGVDLTVVPSSDTRLRVTTISRPTEGRVLDLRLFYVGVAGGRVSAEGAPWLRDALVEVGRIFIHADITIGEVTHHDVPGALGSRFAIIEREGDDRPELSEMLALSAGAHGPGVSVFLVRLVDGALGVSGGIPGPPGMHGTPASGVAISAEGLERYPISLALSIAHELGHYLGLFHTSEPDGTILDALDDTGECRPAQDTDGDGMLSFEECVPLGAASLMFWSARVAVLSFEQRRILRENVILR